MIPQCPVCKTAARVAIHGPHLYHCAKCDGYFDDNPDEGGTHSDRNPAARLEREERRRTNARRSN